MKKYFALLLAISLGLGSCVKDNLYIPEPEEEVPASELTGKLVLNEINGTGADADKYIELYNHSDEVLDLTGVYINYNNVSSNPGTTWSAAAGQTLAPGAFLLLKGTKRGDNPGHDMSTGLSGTQGIVVELLDGDNNRIDYFTVAADADRSNSYARIPDGSGPWYFDDPAGTPGTSNGTQTTGKTPIVEVPTIETLDRSVALPTSDDQVIVWATVTTPEGTTLSGVVLRWSVDGKAQSEVRMTLDGDIYTGTIPAQTLGTTVVYTVVATNSAGGTASASGEYTVTGGDLATTGQIYINECDPDGKHWELYNAEAYDIVLTGWNMTKDNGDSNYDFAEGKIIRAGEYLIITRNVDDGPTFGMSQTSGFVYHLYNAENDLVDVFDNFAGNQMHGNVPAGYTLGRITDGAEQIAVFSTGSIGQSNAQGILLESSVVFIPGDWQVATASTLEPVTIRANLSYYESIQTATIHYNIGDTDYSAPMERESGSELTWSATLPALGRVGTVTYRFETTPGGTAEAGMDNEGNPVYTYTFTTQDGEIDYSGLCLNEIDGNSKCIELYNNGVTAIPLTGVRLLKNESSNPWWTGTQGQMLQPGEYFVIQQSGESADGLPVNDRTGRNGISTKQNLKFELEDADGVNRGTFLRGDEGALGDGISDVGSNSFQRCPDGSGEWKMAAPTIGASNPATGNPIPQV